MAIPRGFPHSTTTFRGRARERHGAAAAQSGSLIEWRSLLALRPNMLIEGEESDVEKTLVALTGDFPSGTCEWSAIASPAMTAPIATIIVREVLRLNIVEHERLKTWLAMTSPRVQVIVTSSTPVFQAVQHGRFPADLYYRLNTVVLTTARAA